MKKLYFLLGILCALGFVACNNVQLMENKVGSVSFTLGEVLAKEIRSVASFRSITSGTSYTVTGVLSGDYSAKSSITVDSGALAKATFSFENIPVGISVTLNLTVQAGNNLVWIGNSESHEVVAGNNSLTVALGRVSGVLMWDNSSVNIAPYGNDEAKTSLLTKEWPYPVWCFDNLGNVYWYIAGENAVIRSKLQADGTYSAFDGNYPGSSDFLAYDNMTDSLYKMIGTEIIEAEESTGINLPEEVISPVAFAVHDNIAYIVEVVGENDVGIPQIIIRNYNLVTSTLLKGSAMYQLPTSFGKNPSYQMIYHEGALYLLLSRVSVGSMNQVYGDDMTPEQSVGLAENYSLGAVLKVNPDTLALDTSFGSDGYLGLSSSKTSFSGITETGYNITNGTVEYSGPDSSNDSSVFYGPQGFVAIMPKKLVIADAGFSVSEVEKNKIALTKKSRIITVDLETLAFETVDVNGSYYQPSITSTGSGYEYIKQD
jgi:hypothetical protein